MVRIGIGEDSHGHVAQGRVLDMGIGRRKGDHGRPPSGGRGMGAENDTMRPVMGYLVPCGRKEGGWWEKPTKFVVLLVTWAKRVVP